jgi:ribosomal protein S21
MRIKDLEKAEDLPMKASIRKSSDYDSWETYRQPRHRAWAHGFMAKHVGECIDDVYSAFKRSLDKRHVDERTYNEMVGWFKGESGTVSAHRWTCYYVDDYGIMCKSSVRRKSRDMVVHYGDFVTVYRFRAAYEAEVFPYLSTCFGYWRARDMVRDGITESEYHATTNEVKRLNNLLQRDDIRPAHFYSWRPYNWSDLWDGYREYPYSRILKYRSREYYRLWYERRDAERKRERETAEYRVYQFNLCEIQHSEKPFLI